MSTELDVNHYEVNNEKVKANCGWITNEFIQELITTREGNEDVRVVESDVKAAVGVGDNYLSIIYQMKVELLNEKTGSKEIRQFLIKGLPSAKVLVTMIEEYGIFQKELYVYNVCLPAMKKIMEEYMPDETDFIAAESYICNLPDVVVLEDLKVLGYKMAHRREQLDFEHAATTVRCLARFHALSIRLVKIKPEVTEVLSRREIYNGQDMTTHMRKAVASWLKVMGEKETTKHVIPRMKKVLENILDKIIYVIGKREGSFLTINHGDSWTNNFMYKYDKDGNVVHARMVDFQITRYACPVLDLLYMMFSSLQPDMLAEKFDEIIKIYHESLASDMKKLRLDPSEIPELEEIKREMRERSIFGVVSMILVAPIVVAKPSDVTNLENIDQATWETSEEYILEKNFWDSLYHEIVIKYMAVMEKLGYLKSAEELVAPHAENGE